MNKISFTNSRDKKKKKKKTSNNFGSRNSVTTPDKLRSSLFSSESDITEDSNDHTNYRKDTSDIRPLESPVLESAATVSINRPPELNTKQPDTIVTMATTEENTTINHRQQQEEPRKQIMTAEEKRNRREETTEERRSRREERKRQMAAATRKKSQFDDKDANTNLMDKQKVDLLMNDEEKLINFVAKVNKVYQEKLKRPAPFMTFVICGMQSTGKSTIMERFMGSVLNIVQEGTGTRCPLDTTCIHDESAIEPRCELNGEELRTGDGGDKLTMEQVFQSITQHNRQLAAKDTFSTKPLHLVVRSQNVQNLRFVDTPGIISNKGTGTDNREDIKEIIVSTMKKPNTKLCVLLEPKEYATNSIIDFCDETFETRDRWINQSIFLMTKFDKQLEDSRTGSKANNFLKEYRANNIYPHLVITPTLEKEDIPTKDLFDKRQKLINSASTFEDERFGQWLEGHETFFQNDPGDELLHPKTKQSIGFSSAKTRMHKIMLEDTALRIPEVLRQIRIELHECQTTKAELLETQKLSDPTNLKIVVEEAMWTINKRIEDYLDGDLKSSIMLTTDQQGVQSLQNELDEEEDSEWAYKVLNHYTDSENRWRDQIDSLQGKYPDELQGDKKLFGGKQVQRAMEFFKVVTIETLPDPEELREHVASGTGYLAGGLQRENWERAMVQITKVCVKDNSHPGINYLIKHIGIIFKRFFRIALEDVKHGEILSSSFKALPTALETYLNTKFDSLLWDVMESAAEKAHDALEPLYSSIDPTLATYALVQAENAKSVLDSAEKRDKAVNDLSSDEMKNLMKVENKKEATSKKAFLPDERSAMITDSEIEKILCRSFQYILALSEFHVRNVRFQLNHYLYQGFKTAMSKNFNLKLINDEDWDGLVQPNPSVENELKDIDEKIAGLQEALQVVQQI